MKRKLTISCMVFIFFAAIQCPLITSAQCTHQVTHMSGTMTINGINVTVTKAGFTDSLNYCGGTTTPYWIGEDNGSMGNGSFSFVFFPPVTGITLNFSAITNSTGGVEEVNLIVNGLHYSIPSLGNINTCEPMSVLTAQGNIGGCTACPGSGTNGITVPGPISSVTVIDSVISSSPNGTVFSIFICDSIQTGIDNLPAGTGTMLFPNPVNNSLNISTDGTQLSEIVIYDLVLKKLIQKSFLNSICLNIEQLSKGIYLYEVRNKNGVIKKGKMVKQ